MLRGSHSAAASSRDSRSKHTKYSLLKTYNRVKNEFRRAMLLILLHHLETRVQNIPSTVLTVKKKHTIRQKSQKRISKGDVLRLSFCCIIWRLVFKAYQVQYSLSETIHSGRVEYEFRRAMLCGSHSAASSRDSHSNVTSIVLIVRKRMIRPEEFG